MSNRIQAIVNKLPAHIHMCMQEGDKILVVLGDPAFYSKYIRFTPEEYKAYKRAISEIECYTGKSKLI